MWIDGSIDGVDVIPFSVFSDDRGWLAELFRSDEIGLDQFPSMGYLSSTKPGKERGPHEHVSQSDRFGFFHGHYRLYMWDNRKSSATYKHRWVLDVGSKNQCMVTIPPGVIHAYKNVGAADAVVLNFPNKLYAGYQKKEKVDEIRHEDIPNSPFILD